jgi:hypothetical protein
MSGDTKQPDAYIQSQLEKTRREDLKYAAFDLHKKQRDWCKRSYEFWCDEGLSLLRNSK